MKAEQVLISNHISPHLNRVMIMDYLIQHEHPSADEIYQSVKTKNSVLSKMTVYNVLKLLVKADIVREVTINDKEVRYDIDTSEHGHFKCRNCHKIIDFDVDLDSIQLMIPKGCSIDKRDLFFYGLCEECLKETRE